MPSIHSLSFSNNHNHLLLLHSITKPNSIPLFNFWYKHGFKKLMIRNGYCSSYSGIVRAVEKDSQQYEIDPGKAKEALQKLDQQLQDLSQKQLSPPKTKASSVKITRDGESREEVEEISGSFLAFVTVVLFLFTIFYNILYITVIDPSVNGT